MPTILKVDEQLDEWWWLASMRSLVTASKPGYRVLEGDHCIRKDATRKQ
jgi:hypothetical protein